MSLSTITAALEAKLRAFVVLHSIPTIWPNKPRDPQGNFIKLDWLHAGNEQRGHDYNAVRNYIGIMQLAVAQPKGTGTDWVDATTALIENEFSRQRLLSGVVIERVYTDQIPDYEDAFYAVIVSIDYQAML